MIIPSIDLQGGNAVQLVGGKERALDAGDPRPLAERFGVVGEVAVIDLDAALGTGGNDAVIRELVKIARCRVGGGIRSLEQARYWLDAGAERIILGTKAVPEILRELPRERVIAALDADRGEVVVEGWQTKTGRGILERLAELRQYVSGFLVTFVEREGRLGGTNLELAWEIVQAAEGCRVTIAGGVTTAEDIAELDRMGADAQVGMALYTGRITLADAFLAPIHSDRSDGLFPTVVCDAHGVALGLCWSSRDSVTKAIDERKGVYQSRKRGLWVKGESSGATQELLRADLDCDRDALRFTVRQRGVGFCHLDTPTCWGDVPGVGKLFRTVTERQTNAPEGSYTARLFGEPGLLPGKLREELDELLEAATPEAVAWEAADLLYFLAVRAVQGGASLERIESELRNRELKVSRRPGNLKPAALGKATGA